MRITIIIILPWEKITQYYILSFYVVQIKWIWTNQFQWIFILTLAGSGLLFFIWVSDRWSTIASKPTLFNMWEKLAMSMANPHSSNSVME